MENLPSDWFRLDKLRYLERPRALRTSLDRIWPRAADLPPVLGAGVVFQPIFRLDDSLGQDGARGYTVHGFEALARWVVPGEDSKPTDADGVPNWVGFPIGARLLRASSSAETLLRVDVQLWQKAASIIEHVWPNGSPYYLFVNSFPESLAAPGLFLEAALAFSRKYPWMVFEIPEADPGVAERELVFMRRDEKTREVYAPIRLAIDDFGVRHANLRRLLDFNYQYVKIDREMRHGITEPALEPALRGLIRGSKQYDKDQGSEILLEGIDVGEEDLLRAWHRAGLRLVQGYLLSKELSGQRLLENSRLEFPEVTDMLRGVAKPPAE